MKNKILMALILSSILFTGCDREAIQAKKEEKADGFSINELSIYSGRFRTFKTNNTSNTYYPVGMIKVDANDDNRYSMFDGDFPIYFSLLLGKNREIFKQSYGRDKGRKIVYISEKDMKLKKVKASMIVGVKNGNKTYAVCKPSETYNGNYKDTRAMQELDKLFEEKYLNQR
ncbi:MAG: hypothetical protein IJ638_02490 [Alphaproteobacteria bacterium]|nr:hypothetical protein [Alphaproteobacteria bacterium]